MAVKYPRQIFDAFGNKVSINIEDRLVAPKNESTTPPLEMHEGSLSRFVVTLLDMSSGSKTSYVNANIPARDIPGIMKGTELCFLKGAIAAKQAGGATEECYTVQLPWGDHKGKTPAAVLIENPEAEESLANMKNLLSQNVSKYPNNAKVIKAIEQAIQKKKDGKLNPDSVTSSDGELTVIYDRNYKYKGKESADGYRQIYGIQISHKSGNKYPWSVRITNCEAPLEKKGDGTVNPIMSKSRNPQSATINISNDDWAYLTYRMSENLRMFESANYGELSSRSQKLEWDNIQAAANKK